jgi:hypothetical protein
MEFLFLSPILMRDRAIPLVRLVQEIKALGLQRA